MKKRSRRGQSSRRPRRPISFEFLLSSCNEEGSRLKIIRMLNDDFRQNAPLEEIFFAPGIREFDFLAQCSILRRIRTHDSFDEEIDPTHEKGCFVHQEKMIWWRIHCFDPKMQGSSPDPSDIHQTKRHLFVSLDGEISAPSDLSLINPKPNDS